MKTIGKCLIIACSVATVFACSKENPRNSNGLVSGDPCEVYLSLSSGTGTRGITDNFVDGTALESKISVVEFYVFDSNGDPDPEVGRIDESTPGNGYKKVETSANDKIYKVTMAGGDDKKIAAVINMNLGELATNTYAGLKAEMAKHAYTANSGDGYNARTEDRDPGFEMSGETVFSIDAGTINNSVTINVSRIASRINAPTFNTTASGFINLDGKNLEEIWGDNHAAILENKTISYTNEGYALINGRAKSNIFFIGNADGNDRKIKTLATGGGTYPVPDWDAWSAAGKDCISSEFTATGDGTGSYTSTYSGESVTGDWFLSGAEADNEHRVYVFENKPGTISVNGTVGYAPAETYALIIKGTFVIDGDDANANGLNRTRYWRIDLTRDDDYHVYRNASYDITVNKISTPGYGSPEEAEKTDTVIPGKDQTAADVKIVISGWRLNTYVTQM